MGFIVLILVIYTLRRWFIDDISFGHEYNNR